MKIGEDILEVTSYGGYSFNGVVEAELPALMAGEYAVTHNAVDTKLHFFEIALADGEKIVIKVSSSNLGSVSKEVRTELN